MDAKPGEDNPAYGAIRNAPYAFRDVLPLNHPVTLLLKAT